jgi:hypothetical protein
MVIKCSQRWELVKKDKLYIVQSLVINKSYAITSLSTALMVYDLLNKGITLSAINRYIAA